MRKDKGITLIALIITIIILLILAGISISALTNTGLFAKAQQAKETTNKAQIKEEVELAITELTMAYYQGEDVQENETLDEYIARKLDGYTTTSGATLTYEDGKIIYTDKNGNVTNMTVDENWKVTVEGTTTGNTNSGDTSTTTPSEEISLSSTVQPGDYVQYTPDTASTTEILSELEIYSGSTENTADTLTQESLNWRVLDVVDEKVRLISEVPTTSTITLYGAKGYNNAVYLIDKTCSTLYNNSTYAEKVQNLKIEDIEEYLTYDYTQYENSGVDTGKYGGTRTYTNGYRYYPNIFVKEKTGWVDGVQGTELNLSEQTVPINEESILARTSIQITQTYWYKSMTSDDFTDSIYYNLFINNGGNYNKYWMSSRCISHSSNLGRALFEVRCISSGCISGASYLYTSADHSEGSGNYIYSYAYALRPVITLNSDIKINTTDATKDGTTAANAYVLK